MPVETGIEASGDRPSDMKHRKKPLKVFIDCRWYSQPGQGAVTYLSGLHEAAERQLRAANSDSAVEFWYGIEAASTVGSALLPPNARVIEVGRRSMLWRLFVFPFFLKRHGFSVAHFTYVCPLINLGVRYLTSIHDVLFARHPQFFSLGHRAPRRILYGLSARLSDIVLTISSQSKEDIETLLGRQGPIHVIPCGPGGSAARTSGEYAPVPSLQPGGFILTVGRIEPRKNYPRLARAFTRSGLASQGAKLVVVGFCPAEFSAELAQFRDYPGVVWLDRVSDENLRWLYAHARAFVYPSHCEGFGIPVIEAMSNDLRVGVSSSYPLGDVVEVADERFDPLDEDAMAESLGRLWGSGRPPTPKASVLARYNWNVAATTYLRLLDSVVQT